MQMHRFSRFKLNGFSIIELLCAILLASLLMAALSGVLISLSKQRQLLISRQPSESWHQNLTEQLRWDFMSASEISATPEKVRLIGISGRDFATGRPLQRPAEITYRIMRRSNIDCLVRQETHIDELTNQNVQSELVSVGTSQMIVERLRRRGGTTTAMDASRIAGSFQPVPQIARITLETEGPGGKPFQTIIVTR